jgi:hypothetical protein
MIIPELNILLDTDGSASISSSVITNTLYKYMGTSSFSIVGIKTGSINYGSSTFGSNVLSYNLNSNYYTTLTNNDTQTIITKNGLIKDTIYSNNRTTFRDRVYTGPYPFAIEIERSGSNNEFGSVHFSRNDGNIKPEISTSFLLQKPITYHVVCQKTGSQLEIYLDGSLVSSGSDYSDIPINITGSLGDTQTLSDTFIGMLGSSKQGFKGTIDEVKICNSAIDSGSIMILAQNELSGSYNYIIGNVFYEFGLLTIACPSSHYSDFIKNVEAPLIPTGSDDLLDGGINSMLLFN